MCGINGIINFNNKTIDNHIHIMNDLLKHRGPDGMGSYKNQNLLLGHTRLSIQDLSDKGAQPMTNDQNLWIVFNGEIYNFKEIKKELIELGHKFYSNTDTEVILNSYKQWGTDAFKKFNGMWAFAIYDVLKKELLISRDRYGVKPCYYFNDNNKFIFSSEIKPILAITSVDLDHNKILLGEHLKEGCFTTDYKNINIIEPGHFYRINLENNFIKKERWWNGLENLFEISPNREVILNQFQEKLNQATSLRLVSDVKISTSLSGGVDSSVIFSELNSINDSILELNPFIVKYDGNITYELAINLCKKFGREPFVVETKDYQNIDNILETFNHLEKKQPYSKQLDLYKLQNKNGYKISIDGHGADECLGGYTENLKDFAISTQNSLVNVYESINHISNNTLLEILKKNFLTPINKYIDVDLSQNFLTNKKFQYIETNEKLQINENLRKDLELLKNFDFSFQSLYLKSNYGFLQWLLNKWDRASMRNSVEIRSPFLDYNLFQFALSIPMYQKVSKGQNKSILRDAYKQKLPEEIINFKAKQGLPSNKNQKYRNLIFENSINEKGFIESNLWDSKKIIKDFNTNDGNENHTEILKICESYLYDTAMKSEINDKKEFSQKFRYNILY